MKVNVRGKNKYTPTSAVVDYAEKKLQRLNHYFKNSDSLEANVLCKVYDDSQVVEVTIPTKNILLRAEVKAGDLFAAIDLVYDKLEAQIRKHKDKIYSSMKRREGVAQYYAAEADFDPEQLNAEVMENNLVRAKTVDLVPMTPDDAITQMEMLGHDFYIFINSETGKTSIVYVREDQNYGIIETK